MADIAKLIRETRKSLNMTQAQFAEAIGAAQGSVSKWESGRETPRMEAISAISNLAGNRFVSWKLISGRENVYRPGKENQEAIVGGSICPGQVREELYWDENDRFASMIPIIGFFKPQRLEGWIVETNDYASIYPRNSVLWCVRMRQAGDPDTTDTYTADLLEDGDILVVGLDVAEGFEIVLRKFVKYREYAAALWVLEGSSEPKAPPIDIDLTKRTASGVTMLGLVAGSLLIDADAARG